MSNFELAHQKLTELKDVLTGVKRLVVLTHDNPDPDCIACAVALASFVKKLYNVPTVVRYSGIIGRAENKEMIRLLKIKIKPLGKNELRSTDRIALVDSQPNTGNVSIPKKVNPLIVIDHHPLRKTTKASFIDVRKDYGATATILSEYLLASAFEINTQLATALCYAISSETQHLARGATPTDTKIYSALFATANKKILSQIENPRLPRDYFKTLNRALHHSSFYKNAIVSNLGEIKAPDFVPIVADLLLKCERMSWSFVIGRYDNKILISLRTTQKKTDAGQFLRRLIGKKGTAGGHGLLAGGQVSCVSTADSDCDAIEKDLISGFLKRLGYKETTDMMPLLVEDASKS